MTRLYILLLSFVVAEAQVQTTSPAVVSIVAPEHPAIYLESRVTGWARVSCVITEDGTTADPKVVSASMPEFGPAAVEAIRKSVFTPALVDGRPVRRSVSIPVDFLFTREQKDAFARARLKEELLPGPPLHDALEVDELPVLLKEIRPKVPTLVKERKILSSAVLGMIVDENGNVRDLHVKEMSLPGCGRAALDAARQWRFRPGLKDGSVVRVSLEVEIVFFPENEQASGLRVKPGIMQSFSDEEEPQEIEPAPGSKQPVVLKSKSPDYPEEMSDRSKSGRARLEYIVGPTGRVSAVRTISATNSYFAIAAERAVCEWVFQPGTIDGRPVATRVQQEFAFGVRR